MEKFTALTGVAAPLPMINVDTDAIIPKQFLKTIERTGLGVHLFHDLRFDETGGERPEFVLNRAPYREARILIAFDNFGCGSSREHAPWALADFGIRCVIAPSFADIFATNSQQNGLLLVTLEATTVDALFAKVEAATGFELRVDLPAQTITGEGFATRFEIEPQRKRLLTEGLDDIGLTLRHADAIRAFEAQHKRRAPWVFA